MKMPIRDPKVIERMRLTMQLFDEAQRIKAQSLRRQFPGISEAELSKKVEEWRLSRPDAPNGDAPGRIAWHRFPEWRYMAEARRAGIRYPDRTSELCRLLGRAIPDPALLLRSMIDQNLPADKVLQVVETLSCTVLDRFLPDLLDNPEYRGIAVSKILEHPDPPAELIPKASMPRRSFRSSSGTRLGVAS